MRVVLAALSMLLACSTVVPAQPSTIEITTPVRQASVSQRPVVEGKAKPKARVFVIVNPLEMPDQFWVQPDVAVQPDGTWRVTVYIGRPGSVDVGKKFAIRAVANPTRSLKEAEVLGGWPEAEASSSVVEVIRR